MPVVQILLVDDSLPWQRFVLTYFETKPEFNVITIAPDGLEAVQKANELRPEVILMDVNLPGINGIEAARRIRRVSPGSKILFLSLHGDSEIVRAAFDAGGSGYVLKLDFNRDLIPAIRTILLGRQFVSHSLTG
jgi:DNA-binding NarL/FixJ family response regulator